MTTPTRTIDLRSDTVTHPTPEMRRAMAEAEVGDDGWSDDPTVNRLEARAAELLGKEAAMFVASGTMGNLVSLLTHGTRGDEVIVGDESHILLHEVGGASALGGLVLRQVQTEANGTLDLDRVEAAIRTPGLGFPTTRLLCIENTHNRRSGRVIGPWYMSDAASLAGGFGLAVHLDGARIFNASIALDLPVAELVQDVDSLSFCLSKGLSCPIGSVVAGTSDFIQRARKIRRMVGGAMRQVGILAAAGLVALDTMVDRLKDDHDNARRLASGLSSLPGMRVDPEAVDTNIVVFAVVNRDAGTVADALENAGVRVSRMGGPMLRMVTHYGIEESDIDRTLEIAETVLTSRSSAL
ncbi:MAG: low-specificity L-threonine aldolase [Dehalococcoidia bacterium]|nr:low-specificity L-threonine aldolase [Dehalococcoidia bacterium]